jgi:cation transport protein ChaC
MPLPDEVFRHTPALRGLIRDPETSPMRMTLERYAEIDAHAREFGHPEDWRLPHEVREANRAEALKGRLDRDLWVFGYGSLIWDPALRVAEIRRATLAGYHRSFCMRLEMGRGSREHPGLMCGLDEGGLCHGAALRIPAGIVDHETEILWMREMISGAYLPTFVDLETPQGPLEALTFVMDPANERYVPGQPVAEAAAMIAKASGILGSNFEYLDSLVRHLAELGLEDPEIEELHRQAKAAGAA